MAGTGSRRHGLRMPHLRLVTTDEAPSSSSGVADEAPSSSVGVVSEAPSSSLDERPRVSLRLLMAASGRCSCDDCLLAFRAGNRRAGIITGSARAAFTPALYAVN